MRYNLYVHDKNCMVRPETITALASTLCLCYWPTTVHNSQFPWLSRP